MDEINHSFSWGGYRPGAGQKPKWNSGATVTIRVPEKLTADILHYARLIDGQFLNGLQISDCLSCQLHNDTVTQSRDLSGKLEEVTKERDHLDQECNELAEKVGMLNLQVEELKQRDDSVTQSKLLEALKEVLAKAGREQKGYKTNSFSQGLKELKQILDSVTQSK